MFEILLREISQKSRAQIVLYCIAHVSWLREILNRERKKKQQQNRIATMETLTDMASWSEVAS